MVLIPPSKEGIMFSSFAKFMKCWRHFWLAHEQAANKDLYYTDLINLDIIIYCIKFPVISLRKYQIYN